MIESLALGAVALFVVGVFEHRARAADRRARALTTRLNRMEATVRRAYGDAARAGSPVRDPAPMLTELERIRQDIP